MIWPMGTEREWNAEPHLPTSMLSLCYDAYIAFSNRAKYSTQTNIAQPQFQCLRTLNIHHDRILMHAFVVAQNEHNRLWKFYVFHDAATHINVMFHNSNCQTTSVSPEQCNSRRSAISIWCVGSIVLPECRGMQRCMRLGCSPLVWLRMNFTSHSGTESQVQSNACDTDSRHIQKGGKYGTMSVTIHIVRATVHIPCPSRYALYQDGALLMLP